MKKMINQVKTLIIVLGNLIWYLLFKRKLFGLKKNRIFEDFYENQIAKQRYEPPNFENHYGKSRDYLMDVFKKMAPESNVLELGCYLSKRLNWFAERNQHLHFTGIDISLDTLRIANNNVLSPNVNLIAADFSNLPFKNRSYDLVFSNVSVYHIPYRQINNVFSEIAKISKKEIILIEPFYEILPFRNKIYLIGSKDKYAHNYRNLKGNNKFELSNITPLFDKSSNIYPITVFHYLRK